MSNKQKQTVTDTATGNIIVRTNFGRAAIGGKTPLPTPPHHHPVTTLTIVTAYDMI